MDISGTDLLSKGERFARHEGKKLNRFEWIEFDRLINECFYPNFLKEAIFHLPEDFTLRTEYE